MCEQQRPDPESLELLPHPAGRWRGLRRPAHQPALHPQNQAAQSRRPAGLHRLLPTRKTGTSARKPNGSGIYAYDDLIARDKASLDIFWLKDDSLDNLDDLPPPEVLAQEIIDHLEAALMSFRDVAAGLRSR